MSNHNSEDKIDEFLYKYDAVVKPSHRMFRRASFTSFGSGYNITPSDVFDNIDYGDIPCVDIHMPEDRFRALVEHDEWLHRRYAGRHFPTGVTDLVVEHERECRIRHENPAVKKAYENYQMLLRMVESNY